MGYFFFKVNFIYMILSDEQLNYICLQLKEIKNPEYFYMSEILDLLYNTGCRGMEAIRTDYWSVTENQYIQLFPQKNNFMRLIDRNDLKPSTIFYLENNSFIQNFTSYKRLNYLLNRHIAHLQLTVYNKPIVTHLFRHNYVRKLMKKGIYIEGIQQLMGHNDIRTTERYLSSVIEYQIDPYGNI